MLTADHQAILDHALRRRYLTPREVARVRQEQAQPGILSLQQFLELLGQQLSPRQLEELREIVEWSAALASRTLSDGDVPVEFNLSATPDPEPPPQRFGDYEIRGEIARGAMGVVLRAYHPTLQRDVAVKVLHTAQQTHRERFELEARAIARLDHPSIVRVHDFGHEGGRPYMVMDLVEGESLNELCKRRGPLPPREAVRIVEHLARAVDYAHRQQVLHRDIKPANVLLRTDGVPVLADFGLARLLDLVTTRVTVSGLIVGTPAFMAPEQALSSKRVDERGDVYSLGATLYFLLTGSPPRPFETGVHFIVTLLQDVSPPSERRPELSARLDAVCLRAMATDPDDRFQSSGELAEALAGLRDAPRTRTLRARHVLPVAALILGAIGGALLLRSADPAKGEERCLIALRAGATPTQDDWEAAEASGASWLPEARAHRAILDAPGKAGAAVAALQPGPRRARLEATRLTALGDYVGAVEVLSKTPEDAALPWERLRPGEPWLTLASRCELDGRPALAARALILAAQRTQGALPRERASWLDRSHSLDAPSLFEAASATLAEIYARAALEALRTPNPHSPAIREARRRLFRARFLAPELDLDEACLELVRLGRSQDVAVRRAARPWATSLLDEELRDFDALLLKPLDADERAAAVSSFVQESKRTEQHSPTWPKGWFPMLGRVRRAGWLPVALKEWLLWRPEASFLWFELGEELGETDPVLALRAFEHLVTLEQTPQAVGRLGRQQLRVGDPEGAVVSLRESLRGRPHSWTAYHLCEALSLRKAPGDGPAGLKIVSDYALRTTHPFLRLARFWLTVYELERLCGNKAGADEALQRTEALTRD